MRGPTWLLLIAGILLSMPVVRAEPVSVTLMLLPMADEVPSDWTASGCISQYDCVDDNPPHDVEATYLTADPLTPETIKVPFQIQNLPNDAETVESVVIFLWVRTETSDPDGSSAYLVMEDDTVCASTTETASTTYTNTTLSYTVDCGGVDDWTPDSVNALRFFADCTDDGIPPAESNCRVTSVGIVVAYTMTGGTFTETEWDLRIGFTVFALLLIVGVFGRQPIFVLLAGIAGVFLAFAAFLATGQEWTLVLFIALGPLLMLVGAVGLMTGDGD